MKKIIIFAAACFALVACSKNEDTHSFKKGQLVTIGVAAPSETKMSSTYDGTTASFKWEEGDQVQVYVNDKPSTFTLVSGAGTDEAEFQGTMPDDGDKMIVMFVGSTSDQTYIANALPKNSVTFRSEKCSINETATLNPVSAALAFDFKGSCNVSKITVILTTGGTPVTYTLTCNPSVALNTTTATRFLVVVQKNSEYNRLDVTVYDGDDLKGTFSKDSVSGFAIEGGKVTLMGERTISTEPV